MFSKKNEQAVDFALKNPDQALEALGVTSETSCAELSEIFKRAYLQASDWSRENYTSQAAVAAAVTCWRSSQKLPPWVARACVAAKKQPAS